MIRLIELKFEPRGGFLTKRRMDLVATRIISVDPQMVSLVADVGDEYGYKGKVCLLLVAASKVVLVAGSLDEIEKAIRPE